MRYQIGENWVDPDSFRLWREGVEHFLTPQMMDLLVYFCEHAGQLVSREQLCEDVWKTVVSDNAVNRAVSKLRHLLGEQAPDNIYIRTQYRKGYICVAKVCETRQDSDDTLGSDATGEDLGQADVRRARPLLIGLAVLASLSAIVWWWQISASKVGSVQTPGTARATQWYDRDEPSGQGDFEMLLHLIFENTNNDLCAEPLNVECQTVNGLSLAETGEVVECTTNGLACRHIDQADQRCDYDYRVRFLCPVDSTAD